MGGGGGLSGFKKVDSYHETTGAGDRVIVFLQCMHSIRCFDLHSILLRN